MIPGFSLGGSGGGSATPGGTALQLQYGTAGGAFGGMAGTSWDDTNRSLTLTGATVTTSKPVLDLSQTWNNVATTFAGVKINITDTTSAFYSAMLDVQLAGATRFRVLKTYTEATGTFQVASGHLNIGTDGYALSWGTSGDVTLARDAANILALRRTTNAQALRVYSTYTDASNGEWGTFDWTTTANTLTIGTAKNGTGATRNFQVVIGGVTKLDYNITNPSTWFLPVCLNVGNVFVVAPTNNIVMYNASQFGWASTTVNNASGPDTYFTRSAAGVVSVKDNLITAAAGGYIRTTGTVVASLVAAATAGAFARSAVTDATVTHAAGVGTTVTGGGTNKVPVYSDGTNWIIG